MSAGRHIAILIGNSEFPEDPSLPALRCPQRDVEGMAAALTAQETGLFVDPLIFINEPHHKVLPAINRVFKQASRQDQILIYYSGHGKQDSAGSLHLATVDTEVDALETTSIAVDAFRRLIDNYACNKVALILDCCYGGAAGKDFLKGSVNDQLQQVSMGRGIYILTASTAIQSAREKEGDQHSLLTKHILDGLTRGEADHDDDGLVSMDDLYEYVKARVPREAPQHPTKCALGVEGEIFVIARAVKKYSPERLRAFREIIESLDSYLPVGVFDQAIQVIRAERPKRDKEFLSLLEDLSEKRVNVGEFVSRWLNLGLPFSVRQQHELTPATENMDATEAKAIPDAGARRAMRRVDERPTPARLHLHFSYLAHWTPRSSAGPLPSSPSSGDEHWEEIARWNAFPEMPSFEEIDSKVRARQRARITAAAAAFTLGSSGATLLAGAWLGLPWIQVPMLSIVAGGLLAWPVTRLAEWLFDRWTRITMPEAVFWDWEGQRSFQIQDYWRSRADASHYEPRHLLWHPHQPYLFAARDHCLLSGWRWEEDQGTGKVYGPSPLSTVQAIFSIGWLKGVVWSETSFLTQAESFWWWKHDHPTHHWIVYDAHGVIRAWIIPRYEDLGLFGPVQDGALLCNPWRPNHENQLLVLTGQNVVATCAPFQFPPGKLQLDNCAEINAIAAEHLDLSRLQLAQHDKVDSYAWHPSGEYLALAVGGRIHVVHWESAELVAFHVPPTGESYSARGWNQVGSLLALDPEAKWVWDARAGIARASQPSERWPIRAEGSLDRKRTSCDGARYIQGPGVKPSFGTWAGIGSAHDAAWSPSDPDVFATIGGDGCSRDIRIWRRRAAGDEQPIATSGPKPR